MATVSSGTNILSKRYAVALLELAAKSKHIEKVEKDLDDLSAMIASSEDLRKMIANPLISKGRKLQSITDLATSAKFQDLTVKFLGVLARNARLPYISGIIASFRSQMRMRR